MLRLEKTIRKEWEGFTPSERKLGDYLLAHLHEIPFETAASIGKRMGVSPMTVGRYIRKLGYADLREIKAELRARAGAAPGNEDVTSRLAFAPSPLKTKIDALVEADKLPQTAEWRRIVKLIATASTVHVASFHVGRFLGLGFATNLHCIRPRVYFSDGGDGSYADVLLDADPASCLVLIDFRRYARHFKLLAEEAAARNIRTIIIADSHCHWARTLTENVLTIETDFGLQSISMAQVVIELLLAAIAGEIDGSDRRLAEVHRLREKFVGFAETESGGRGRRGRL